MASLERQSQLSSAEDLARQGRTHEAIAVYRELLAEDPQDAEVIGKLADQFSRLAEQIRSTVG